MYRTIAYGLRNPIIVMEIAICIVCILALIRGRELKRKPRRIINLKQAGRLMVLQVIFFIFICMKVMAMSK